MQDFLLDISKVIIGQLCYQEVDTPNGVIVMKKDSYSFIVYPSTDSLGSNYIKFREGPLTKKRFFDLVFEIDETDFDSDDINKSLIRFSVHSNEERLEYDLVISFTGKVVSFEKI